LEDNRIEALEDSLKQANFEGILRRGMTLPIIMGRYIELWNLIAN